MTLSSLHSCRIILDSMGGACTTPVRDCTSHESVVLLYVLTPAYYIHQAQMSPRHIKVVRETWSKISTEQHTSSDSGLFNSFVDIFYGSIVNFSQNLNSIVGEKSFPKEEFLKRTVKLLLGLINKKPYFTLGVRSYVMFCIEHDIRGYELGLFGSIFLQALQRTLCDAYDSEAEHAWTLAYSIFLCHTLPVLVKRSGKHSACASTVSSNGEGEETVVI